jgi:hypothetical protein
MYRVFVALFFANLLGGCHLIFPFDTLPADSGSDSTDGGITDGYLPDGIIAEGLKPDAEMVDSKLFDAHPPDIILPDTFSPDIDLCKGVNCGAYGSCNSSTGKCDCVAGYDGVGCDKCDFAYGPTYPACNALTPTVAIVINCTSPCKGGSTVDVDVTFTNTISYMVKVECVDSAACVISPQKAGKIYIPPNTTQALSHTGTLSGGTTNVPQTVTVKWVLGPGPADVRFRAYAYGVPTTTTVEDNKSIAIK